MWGIHKCIPDMALFKRRMWISLYFPRKFETCGTRGLHVLYMIINFIPYFRVPLCWIQNLMFRNDVGTWCWATDNVEFLLNMLHCLILRKALVTKNSQCSKQGHLIFFALIMTDDLGPLQVKRVIFNLVRDFGLGV